LKTWSLRGCWIFFLLNYFPGGGRFDGLVDARVFDLFRVQLLSGGRCLKTWSLRGCWIFFVFNYFPGGGASLRPGRCEVAGSFSCTKSARESYTSSGRMISVGGAA
jgi:hypothetical protein